MTCLPILTHHSKGPRQPYKGTRKFRCPLFGHARKRVLNASTTSWAGLPSRLVAMAELSRYEFGLLGSFFKIFMSNSATRRKDDDEEEYGEENPVYLSDSELYVQYLLPTKNGFPLWHPKPNDNLPEQYKREGAGIGDVVVPNEFGGVNFLFNSLRDFDEDFDEDFDNEQRQFVPEQHKADSFVASNQSRFSKSHISYDLGTDAGPTPGVSFSATTPKGALLILPEGGKREDHLQPHIFASYAAECALSWYAYTDQRGFGLPDDALYLITGCDKARAWGLASYHKDSSSLDRAEPVTLDFVRKSPSNLSTITADGQRRPQTSSSGYFFPRVDYAAVRNDEVEDGYGAVFVRGFKIAIRGSTENTQKFTLAPDGDVDVALTHDDDWASLIRKNEIEMPEDHELIRRLGCCKDRQLVKSRTKDGKVFACFMKIEREGRMQNERYPNSRFRVEMYMCMDYLEMTIERNKRSW
ncbi:hypothetical protein D9757_011361 [Collybiopsis confluens]|uniref:Uncharacterized protein n=1 Tax=Collybiopsis confluens TaxID=2823264 RepID=A0A8H5GAT0_9AGAR|nr:hypothetical protein D9757_011361 [Collybiopsis confluens]